jgi:hypothetical protein
MIIDKLLLFIIEVTEPFLMQQYRNKIRNYGGNITTSPRYMRIKHVYTCKHALVSTCCILNFFIEFGSKPYYARILTFCPFCDKIVDKGKRTNSIFKNKPANSSSAFRVHHRFLNFKSLI